MLVQHYPHHLNTKTAGEKLLVARHVWPFAVITRRLKAMGEAVPVLVLVIQFVS